MWCAQDDSGSFPEVVKRSSSLAAFTSQPIALGSPPLLMGPSPASASTFGSSFGPSMRSSFATDTTYPVGAPLLYLPGDLTELLSRSGCSALHRSAS